MRYTRKRRFVKKSFKRGAKKRKLATRKYVRKSSKRFSRKRVRFARRSGKVGGLVAPRGPSIHGSYRKSLDDLRTADNMKGLLSTSWGGDYQLMLGSTINDPIYQQFNMVANTLDTATMFSVSGGQTGMTGNYQPPPGFETNVSSKYLHWMVEEFGVSFTISRTDAHAAPVDFVLSCLSYPEYVGLILGTPPNTYYGANNATNPDKQFENQTLQRHTKRARLFANGVQSENKVRISMRCSPMQIHGLPGNMEQCYTSAANVTNNLKFEEGLVHPLNAVGRCYWVLTTFIRSVASTASVYPNGIQFSVRVKPWWKLRGYQAVAAGGYI